MSSDKVYSLVSVTTRREFWWCFCSVLSLVMTLSEETAHKCIFLLSRMFCLMMVVQRNAPRTLETSQKTSRSHRMHNSSALATCSYSSAQKIPPFMGAEEQMPGRGGV